MGGALRAAIDEKDQRIAATERASHIEERAPYDLYQPQWGEDKTGERVFTRSREGREKRRVLDRINGINGIGEEEGATTKYSEYTKKGRGCRSHLKYSLKLPFNLGRAASVNMKISITELCCGIFGSGIRRTKLPQQTWQVLF